MTLYFSSENDTDYKEVKAILDNLVWNGEHIPYFYDYSGYFRIPFWKVKALTSIIPNYESYHIGLNGCIQINLGYDFGLSVECPCVRKDDAVSKYRTIRWYEHLNKLPVTPWGIADKNWVMDVCPFKTELKLLKTTKKIGETILRWLDMSYKLIKEGYEWSISAGVQKDIQQYIEHKENIYALNAEMNEVQKKIDLENARFRAYHSKFMDSFRKVKNISKDF